jgi:hypothetical protein
MTSIRLIGRCGIGLLQPVGSVRVHLPVTTLHNREVVRNLRTLVQSVLQSRWSCDPRGNTQ